MRILVTGITGVGKKAYLKEVVQRGSLTTELIHMETVMREVDPTRTFAEENMYQMDRNFLHLLWHRALDKILEKTELAEKAGKSIILEMHANYYWDHSQFQLADPIALAKLFAPDICVTLIDNVHAMLARLQKRKDLATQRFLGDGVKLQSLMFWRTAEINTTEVISKIQVRFDPEKKCYIPSHFIIARDHDPEILAQLITQSRWSGAPSPWPVVYASFPITSTKNNLSLQEQISRFRTGLRQKFIVLDPYTITEKQLENEILKNPGKEQFTFTTSSAGEIELTRGQIKSIAPLINGQIIDRDYRLVNQSEMVILYIPLITDKEGHQYPFYSSGSLYERGVGWSSGKPVFIITEATAEQLGPFGRVAHQTFSSFDEAMEWFKKTKK